MNKQNIQDLINLLETIDEADFNLSEYAHPCGSPACVAGHATTLDSWKLGGGRIEGMPIFLDETGGYAFAVWADIAVYHARVICGLTAGPQAADFYGASYINGRVSASMAAAALKRYLTTGRISNES
jgi:hypothetical protein